MNDITFDTAIALFVEVLRSAMGPADLEKAMLLRDVYGRLSCIVDLTLDEPAKADISSKLADALGPFARPERVLATRSDAGAAAILESVHCQHIKIHLRDQAIFVRLLDRKVIGTDWLVKPNVEPSVPPRFVFTSMKGGVGRTTALCVVATELAAAGKNILVVDLDLEAPGVGGMLLAAESVPRFGVVDFLAMAAMDQELAISELRGSAGHADGGRIDVLPALGSEMLAEHYLAKLSRALLDASPTTDVPLHHKLNRMLELATASRQYDAILIDVRAGLSEISAGPILALGAAVLLFGTAQKQTFDDMRLLFAHLATLAIPGDGALWKNLCPVLAKTPASTETVEWAQNQMYLLFQEFVYEEQEGLDGYNFDEGAIDAPHRLIPIAFNPTFSEFDPSRRPADLTRGFYQATFEPLLNWFTLQTEPT